MFDLIKHLVKNDIQHTVSDNGNITVANSDDEDVLFTAEHWLSGGK